MHRHCWKPGQVLESALTVRIPAHAEIHHSVAKLPVFILFHCQLLSQVLQCRFILGGGKEERGHNAVFY